MSRRSWIAAALVLALLPVGSTPAPEVGAVGSLGLEDVVRMHVAGTPVERIIATIASSDVDFDLSDEMLVELRYAGLPEPLIEAMQQRQRELHPPAEGPAPPIETGPAPLRLLLRRGAAKDDPGAAAPEPLRVLDVPPPGLLAQLGIEPAPITDLALWVGCTTATHVPDHWRGQSPLGRDFSRTPRHRLLAFRPGATIDVDGSGKAGRVLALAIPASLEVELDPGEDHALIVGLAVGIADRYANVVDATIEGFVPAAHGGRLEVVLEDGAHHHLSDLKVTLAAGAASPAPPAQ